MPAAILNAKAQKLPCNLSSIALTDAAALRTARLNDVFSSHRSTCRVQHPDWPSLVNRPGLDLYTGPCEKPAGTYHRSFALVPSTLQGLDAPRLRARAVPIGVRRRHFGHAACLSWALESVDIGLSRAAFVPSTLFLSSMRHHQVLCVLSVCCLHVV